MADGTVITRSNMRSARDVGEDRVSNEPDGLEEVQRRLGEIQHRKRGGMRWNVSRHTAEMAIGAIEQERPPTPKRQSGKKRRRKRGKRLL